MIKKISVTKLFTDLFKQKQGVINDRSIMHPEREWFFGILGGILFLIVGLFWSTSIYSQFSNVSTENVSEINDNGAYRETLVEAALSILSERQRTYGVIKAKLINQAGSIFIEPANEPTLTEDVVEVEEVGLDTVVEIDSEFSNDPPPLAN